MKRIFLLSILSVGIHFKSFSLVIPKLIPVMKDSLWGYCNEKKQIVIKPKYERVTQFKEGYAVVFANHKSTLIDQKGTEIIPPIYDDLRMLNKGFYLARLDRCSYGIVNINGEEIIPVQYTMCMEYKGYIIAIKATTYYFFDLNGKLLISHEYNGYQPFMDYGSEMYGDAIPVWKNEKAGLLKYTGEEIIPTIYDQVSEYWGRNYRIVHLNGKAGMYNIDGKMIHEVNLDSLDWPIAKLNNKFGILNESGIAQVPFIYDNMRRLYLGYSQQSLYLVTRENKMGIIDSVNNPVVPLKYEPVESTKVGFLGNTPVNGCYKIYIDNKFGLVDEHCKEKVAVIYEYINKFGENYSYVKRNGKVGIIDLNGKEVVPCKYENLGEIENNIVPIVEKKITIGYVDLEGNEYFIN